MHGNDWDEVVPLADPETVEVPLTHAEPFICRAVYNSSTVNACDITFT